MTKLQVESVLLPDYLKVCAQLSALLPLLSQGQAMVLLPVAVPPPLPAIGLLSAAFEVLVKCCWVPARPLPASLAVLHLFTSLQPGWPSAQTLQALSCMQAILPYLPPFPQVSALRTVAAYFRQHVTRRCPNRAGGNSVLIAPGDSDPAQPTFLIGLLNHCPHCAVQHEGTLELWQSPCPF